MTGVTLMIRFVNKTTQTGWAVELIIITSRT